MSRIFGSTPTARIVALAASLFATVASDIAAQGADTVRVGDPKLRFALRSETVGDESFLVNKDASMPGPKSTKETREVACGPMRCYLIVMMSATPRGNLVDSVWVNRDDLALVRHVEHGFGNHTEVNVAAGRIKGVAADSGKPVRNIDAAAPAFDYSVLEEIVTALPLTAGYRATVHAFDVTQGFRDVGVTVTGAELLQTRAGKRDTWVVEFSFGTHKATRWIDKETRAGLKWLVDMGNGRSMWGQPTAR